MFPPVLQKVPHSLEGLRGQVLFSGGFEEAFQACLSQQAFDSPKISVCSIKINVDARKF
jgi:hypothetical protein